MAESTKKSNDKESADGATISTAKRVLAGVGPKRGLARLWPFLGPAFVASVAYVDPGNFATNIQGGAKFGYTLLWVIVASNVMGMLIQTLSAKLGIATGHNLAELCRMHFSRPVVWMMWGIMELVAMATDLAEFVGAALGLNLLFHIPLGVAGILTAFITFLILALQSRGFRLLEAVITALLGVVAVCYLLETILDKPNLSQVLRHAVVPSFSGTESVVLAAGILGATIMPHVIFLHSSLMQGRVVVKDPGQKRRLFHFEIWDVTIAMGVAGLINAAMLIMAAATFHRTGMSHVASIESAHVTLQPLLGVAAGWIFAVSLLASGLASTTVGTMAGQVIMQGFLSRHIPVWVRRLVTMLPSLVVIFLGLDPTRTLVLSQVILSFGLPFAVVPLIIFSRRRDLMGDLVNLRTTTIASCAIAVLILSLNVYLLFRIFFKG